MPMPGAPAIATAGATVGAVHAPHPPTAAESVAPTEQQLLLAMQTHLLAIMRGLSPDEQAHVDSLVMQLSVDQREAWVKELALLSVPAAIERVRDTLRRMTPPATQGVTAAGSDGQAPRPATSGAA